MSNLSKTFFTKNLLERVLSALVLIPVVLWAVYAGGWAFFLLVVAGIMASMAEYLRLTVPMLSLRGKIWAYGAAFLILSVGFFKSPAHAFLLSVPAAALTGYYAGCSVGKEGRRRLMGWGAACVPYLLWSGLSMIHLRNMQDAGLGLIVYLLLVVWGTDTGAYFAGRLIGGPKLLPEISPKKTWAGLIGGMAFAAGFGYAVALVFDESRTLAASVVAPLMAIVAQAGDFFESWIKRRAGAKDSGTLIPGHGGMLDRVDGLLFAALFLAVVVQLGMVG